MENVLLTGVCPICCAYVMVAPGVTESEIISCGDCYASLIVEHVATRTLFLTKAAETIPL
jgi:hypothetical protein